MEWSVSPPGRFTSVVRAPRWTPEPVWMRWSGLEEEQAVNKLHRVLSRFSPFHNVTSN